MRFDDQIVFITGGASGIGKKTAEGFLAKGAKVAVADINDQMLKAFVDEYQAQSENILVLKCDVRSEDNVDKAVTAILEKWGRVDVLVNCHGIYQPLLLDGMTYEWFDRTIKTNLYGVFNTCKRVVKEMSDNKYGRIINIVSIAGQRGSAGNCPYAASKRGIEGFSKSLAREVAADNVLINCIAPGIIKTPMNDFDEPEEKRNARYAEWNAATALGRFGEPEELAGAIWFLASKYASYITGVTLDVNGGMGIR